jgi:HAD superfamily hydrolase (TIGR01509 family)
MPHNAPIATNFQAVIFDMDGLLLDSERIALEAFRFACARFNLGDQYPVFLKCLGTHQAEGEKVLYQAFRALANVGEFIDTWDKRYLMLTSTAIPLKPGALKLLQRLSALKLPLAVATSTKTIRAKDKLDRAGLLAYFAVIVGGDQAAQSKPEPDIYWHAASLLDVKPAACLVLEDSENGVRAGIAAGMSVIQIPDLLAPSAELLALGAGVMTSLDEVLELHFR